MKKKKKSHSLLFRFKSIQSTMMLSFGALIILALCLFLVFSLRYAREEVLYNAREYTGQLVEQISQEMESYIAYMENISTLVTGDGNSEVTDYLFSEEGAKDKKLKKRVLNQFAMVLKTHSDILNIAAIAENGRALINDGTQERNPYAGWEEMDWYQKTIEAGGETVLSSSHVQNAVRGRYDWVVTLSKALRNPATGKLEGIFFIDLNYSTIQNLCEKVYSGHQGYLFLTDRSGSIIYHPKQKLLLAGMQTECLEEARERKNGSFVAGEGEARRLYTVRTSENTGWTTAGVTYMKDLMKNRARTQTVYGLIAFSLFVLAALLAALLSRAISRPLMELREAMKRVEQGSFDNSSFELEGENEIASLGKSFLAMTEKIQSLMEQNVREQREKRKSELRALQSQVNPHFLYNTLDSIIWMAESGRDREVVLMTSSLAKLLRQSISNEEELVTIGKELDYTRSYLTIQKMRYRDQLEFDIDVDVEILDQPMVKLVIQPLVENAIYHGIKYLDGPGMIWVTGARMGKQIVLAVRDNGVGMEEEERKHILEKKESAESHKNNGVGVWNVHNRLQLYYGEDYGLRYESRRGIGTTVYIRIPADGAGGDTV